MDLTPEQNDAMPLLAKVPNLEFDVERLQWCMKHIVLQHPPHWAGGGTSRFPMRKYGGWSLTSSSGGIHDGWQSVYGWTANGWNLKQAYKNGYIPRWFHTKKTSICVDYLETVVDTLSDLGFVPHNVRIWIMTHGGHHIAPHTDGPDNRYQVRLHVPIQTNLGCVHEWYADPEDYKVHIPADGSAYMFRTNIMHDTFNHGHEDRYHFIAEVYDTKHVVAGYGYDQIDTLDARYKQEMQYFLGRDTV